MTCRSKKLKLFRSEIQEGGHLENLFFASSSELKGQLTWNLVGSIGVTCRSKIAQTVLIGSPKWRPWQPSWKSILNFFSWTERQLTQSSLEVSRWRRSTVAKIILIGNPRWPSCLCLLYSPATVLFTCIKSWFFRNHLANCHQISLWSYCWNVIESLFKWSRSIDSHADIFFFKIKNCLNDDHFISCNDRIGKMLHNRCMSAIAMSLRWVTRGTWASCNVYAIVEFHPVHFPMTHLNCVNVICCQSCTTW